MTAGFGRERHGFEVQNPKAFSRLPVAPDSVVPFGFGSLGSEESRQPDEE